ncbi:MAG: hypothetical protein L3J39_10845 [Verrucomicrobiales bacterium]|nr:hypothetical protein [Verrucomicrobiales bacterium]
MSHPLRALFIDMDSYFASVEQHVQPQLRGRPVGIAPMLAETTCCIAASYEAKAYGVKTGTMVADARRLCPGIKIIEARPPLYVDVHHQIVDLVESCIHVDHVLSIDEMICWLPKNWRTHQIIHQVADQIKAKMTSTFSDALGCSIGVAPNGWLAKMASKMEKPDGLVIIESDDLPEKLYSLELKDLHGIGSSMELRLHAHGIHSVRDLCATPKSTLHGIWKGVEGYRMWHKLRGELVEDYTREAMTRSISHGHVLAPDLRQPSRAIAVVHRLTQKAGTRMRHQGLLTSRLELHLRYVGQAAWSAKTSFPETTDSLVLTQSIKFLWQQRPHPSTPIRKVNIVLGKLVREGQYTPSLFEPEQSEKRNRLNETLDSVNAKYGKQALYLGGAHEAIERVQAKIAFHHIPDMKVED